MNILIIDKLPLTRTGMRLVIQQNFPEATITELDDHASLSELKQHPAPNLTIIALDTTKSSDNMRLINAFRGAYPASKMVVYDQISQHEMIERYFDSGIVGYLSRQSGVDDLLDCIAKVMEGKKFIDNEAMISLIQRKFPTKQPKPTATAAVEHSRLTDHELMVARYLVNGMKVTAIANILTRKVSTVSTIKSKIFKKLDIDNIVSLGEVIRK